MESRAHHLTEPVALKHLTYLRVHPSELWVHRHELIHDLRIREDGGHLLEELRRIHHVLQLSMHHTPMSETSDNPNRKPWEAHHIRIVRVHAHIRERVETSHSPEAQMTVQLREGVVRILTGLHLRQGLRWSGSGRCSTPSGPGCAFHHMDGVPGLDLVV